MLTQSQLGESLSEWSWPGQRGSKRNTTSPGFWTESKLHCAASFSGSKHKKGLKNTYLLGHKLMKGSKECLFISTQTHNLQIFGGNPLCQLVAMPTLFEALDRKATQLNQKR